MGQMSTMPPIPKEIARRAQAIFGSSNFYLRLGNKLETVLEPIRSHLLLNETPGFEGPVPSLALVSFFQYMEGLCDTQAADALRTRIDWQYALHTPVRFPVLHPQGLCTYRNWLVNDAAAQQEFQALIDELAQLEPPAGDATPVRTKQLLASICATNRVKWVYNATHDAVAALAGNWPLWLEQIALPHWYTFYRNQPASSLNHEEQDIMAQDAHYLLQMIQGAGKTELSNLPEVKALELVCRQQLVWSQTQPAQFLPACRSYGACPMATSAKEGQALQKQTDEFSEGSDESRRAAPSSGG